MSLPRRSPRTHCTWSIVLWSIVFAGCCSSPVKMRSGYRAGFHHYPDLISLLNRQCGNSNYVNVILHSNTSMRDLADRNCASAVLSLNNAASKGLRFENRTSFTLDDSFTILYNLVAYNVPLESALETLNEYSFLQRHVDLACFIFFNQSSRSNWTLTSSIDAICCQAIFIYDELQFNSGIIQNLMIESLHLKYSTYEFGAFVLSRTARSVCSNCGVARSVTGGFEFTFDAPERLEVAFVNCTPHFIVGSDNSTGEARVYPKHGTETWLLNDSAAFFNFSYRLYENQNKSWGNVVGEGRNRFWVGLVADVFNQAVDLAVTEISNTYSRNQAIQYTQVFVMEKSLFVSKKGTQVPSASALWWPLDSISWSMTIASLFLYTLTLTAFVRFYDNTSIPELSREFVVSRKSRDLPPADIIMLVSTLARQSHDGYREYKTLSYKVLISWWWVFAMIITHLYSSLLLSFMSVPAFLPGADTFERLLTEMKAGRMTAGAQKTSFGSGILRTYDHPVAKFIIKNFFKKEKYFPKERGTGMFLAADDQLNYAFVDMQNFIMAMMRANNWNRKLQLSRSYFSVTGSSWVLQKRCFMLPYFNDFIRREMEAGLIALYLNKALAAGSDAREVGNRIESIEFDDIFGHLYLYGVGISVSFACFLLEKVFYRRKKTKKLNPKSVRFEVGASSTEIDADRSCSVERTTTIEENLNRLNDRLQISDANHLS